MIGPQKQGAPRDAAPRDARAVVCTSAASGASGKGAEAMESAGGVVFRDKKAEALADLDGRIGLLEAFPFGLQHVLAMFVANLAPIAIIVAAAGLSEDMRAVLIQNAMLIAGIGTFSSCIRSGAWAAACPSSWASASPSSRLLARWRPPKDTGRS